MSIEQQKSQAVHNLMNTMAAVQKKSQIFVERINRQESLNQNQIMLLFQLRLTGSLNITDISERFVITPGAASSMCDKLEDAGLIERLRTKEDRRVVNIVITDEGTRRILKLFDSFEAIELEKFADTLQKINELMNEIIS
ncbi:putative HTH-type transcriptional regulator YusO [compost metagenome]